MTPAIASHSDSVPVRYVQSFCISLNTLAVVCKYIQMTTPFTLGPLTSHTLLSFPTDFFPVYFQACKGVSPVLSGIYTLSLCAFAPAAILAGLSVKATGRYRPQMWVAWVIVLVAMGLLSAPTTNTLGMGIGTSVGYLVLLGFGTGYVRPFVCSFSHCPSGLFSSQDTCVLVLTLLLLSAPGRCTR